VCSPSSFLLCSAGRGSRDDSPTFAHFLASVVVAAAYTSATLDTESSSSMGTRKLVADLDAQLSNEAPLAKSALPEVRKVWDKQVSVAGERERCRCDACCQALQTSIIEK
jgi:hypothetical protein